MFSKEQLENPELIMDEQQMIIGDVVFEAINNTWCSCDWCFFNPGDITKDCSLENSRCVPIQRVDRKEIYWKVI